MLLYLVRSDERKGIFFPRRERESNLSLRHDDVGLRQFFTYFNGLFHLFIFMYLFVTLFIFIREILFNLNWLRVSAVDAFWLDRRLHPPLPPPILCFYWDTSFIGQNTNLSYDCFPNKAYLSTCFNVNKCLKPKTLRSLNSWWTLSIDLQRSS